MAKSFPNKIEKKYLSCDYFVYLLLDFVQSSLSRLRLQPHQQCILSCITVRDFFCKIRKKNIVKFIFCIGNSGKNPSGFPEMRCAWREATCWCWWWWWWWSTGQCSPSCLSVLYASRTTKARGECQHVGLTPSTTTCTWRLNNLQCRL